MKKCSNCGRENADDASFCIFCGSSFDTKPQNNTNDASLNKENKRNKNRIDAIRTFNYLYELFFISTLIFCLTKYVSIDTEADFFGFSFYYILLAWGDPQGSFINYFIVVFNLIVVIANISVTFFFSYLGIKECVKQHDIENKVVTLNPMYLIIVLFSNILATSLLKTTLVPSKGLSSGFGEAIIQIFGTTLLFVSVIVINCFEPKSSKKNRKFIDIAMFFVMSTILNALGESVFAYGSGNQKYYISLFGSLALALRENNGLLCGFSIVIILLGIALFVLTSIFVFKVIRTNIKEKKNVYSFNLIISMLSLAATLIIFESIYLVFYNNIVNEHLRLVGIVGIIVNIVIMLVLYLLKNNLDCFKIDQNNEPNMGNVEFKNNERENNEKIGD